MTSSTCACKKYIFLVIGILLSLATFVVLLFGYFLPMTKTGDYTLQTCKVMLNKIIVESRNYQGIVNLVYLSLNKDVTVVTNPLRSYVVAYLNLNYSVGSDVNCFVSSDDIEISIFINPIGLIFVVILAILAFINITIFIILALRGRYLKRSEYIDLDVVRENRPN